jgi:peptidoglycan/xylan/chitin deacetylase (PgdA/CDA1 family)
METAAGLVFESGHRNRAETVVRDFEYVTNWKESVSIPSGLRARAGSYLRHAALDLLGVADRFQEKVFLRCLYCHYVFDDQVQRFEHLIAALKRVGRFIDTPTCLSILEGRRRLDGRYFHLSFDDGFRNLFTNALPILRRQGVPAIFFVPTSLIGADWEATRDYCVNKVHHRGVVEMLKWEDLAEIASAGHEIGSHTRTHARFSAISHSPALLENEILGSKTDIEQALGLECRCISWPYGRMSDADAPSLQMAQAAGYRGCFGAFRGSIVPNRTNAYSIPRHHFEVQWPLAHVNYFARGNWEQIS